MKNLRPFFVFLGALALAYLVWDYGLTQLLKDLQTAGWWSVLLVLTFIPTLVCYALAWSLLTEWENPFSPKNLWRMIRMMGASIAWNNLTPFLKVGGEPAKVFMLGAYIGRRKALMSTLIYNLVHLLATLFSFISVAFILPLFYPINQVGRWLCLGIGSLGLLIFLAIVFFPILWRKVLSHKLYAFFVKMNLEKSVIRFRWVTRKTSQFFIRHRERVVIAFFLEVFARFVEGLTFYLAFILLKNPISFLTSCFLEVGRSLADTIFFFVPYQVGSREQGVGFLLKDVFHHGSHGFLTAVFMYRFVEIAWVLIGYLLWVKSRSTPLSKADK